MAPKKTGRVIPADAISAPEAAALKGLAPRTLTQHAASGHVPGAVKIGEGRGGVWVFSQAAVLAWTPRERGRPPKAK